MRGRNDIFLFILFYRRIDDIQSIIFLGSLIANELGQNCTIIKSERWWEIFRFIDHINLIKRWKLTHNYIWFLFMCDCDCAKHICTHVYPWTEKKKCSKWHCFPLLWKCILKIGKTYEICACSTIQFTINVTPFPAKLSASNLVNWLSRYGMWPQRFFVSLNEAMQ